MVKEVLPFNLGSAKDWSFLKLLILIVALFLSYNVITAHVEHVVSTVS